MRRQVEVQVEVERSVEEKELAFYRSNI